MPGSRASRGARRQQILEALASELETRPGSRITTARLAEVIGVSEAALYRHFPSKARMFESLIEFAEESVFGITNRIAGDDQDAREICRKVLTVVLTFSARNPGITRVLLGDALVGENDRLRARVAQFFDRLETLLKQVLREAGARGQDGPALRSISVSANLMIAAVEGRMTQYVRGEFQREPLDDWPRQWDLLARGLFDTVDVASV